MQTHLPRQVREYGRPVSHFYAEERVGKSLINDSFYNLRFTHIVRGEQYQL